jgi:hypothetical protein
MRSFAARMPARLKRYVRRAVVDPARRMIDDWTLERAITMLRDRASPDRTLLASMRHAWGNEAYSADLSYLLEVVAHVRDCHGAVLECGTGLTTLVAGVLAERRGVTVHSLEQDADWAEVIERALARHQISTVRVTYAPLHRYGNFVWYAETAMWDSPKWFDLVLCDGPAVFEHWGPVIHAQWRYGVFPVLAARSVGAREILLEDADDPRAEAMLRRWRAEFATSHRLISSADGISAVVTWHG